MPKVSQKPDQNGRILADTQISRGLANDGHNHKAAEPKHKVHRRRKEPTQRINAQHSNQRPADPLRRRNRLLRNLPHRPSTALCNSQLQ